MNMTFQQLAIALGLGLLVGLQRERAASRLAGFRTFPLVTMLGAVAALLIDSLGPWIVIAGFLGVIAMVVVGNIETLRTDRVDPGQTTEIAVLMMYAVGVYVVLGSREVAIAIGAAVAVLLHLKTGLHRFAGQLTEADARAIMQFAVLSMVILPVLPNTPFGPYAVLNLRQIWLMVVLIVGIGLAGYVAYKIFGARTGTLLAGVLGGMVSSTATTVSYARQSRQHEDGARAAAVVIILASAVVPIRVLVEIAVVSPSFLTHAATPFGILLVTFLLIAAATWIIGVPTHLDKPTLDNPSELRTALVFAGLYAAVIVAVAAGQDHFGDKGLYAVAALSGLTDVDAITLSTSQLVHAGQIVPDAGWKAIMIATLSNVMFKGATVAVLGSRRLIRRVATVYIVVLLVGLGIMLTG